MSSEQIKKYVHIELHAVDILNLYGSNSLWNPSKSLKIVAIKILNYLGILA